MRDQYDKFQYLVTHFNWHSPSWDLFIFLFWAVASVIYAFAAGRGRALSILVSVYISKLLVLEAPFLTKELEKHLHGQYAGFGKVIVFVGLFLILFLFLSRYAFKTTVDRKQVSGFIFTLLLAILQIGLLINIVISLLPQINQSKLTPLVSFLFIGPTPTLLWLIAPIIFLILLGRHISDHSEV